ncbi:hypothetical protein Tco_0017294 [Tanacetum coccineum]
MANLRYSDKHNMVAFLKKPNESVGFTKIVDFLKGTSLRSKLQLADAAGISNLPDADIYDGLATLRYVSEGDHVPLLPAMLTGATEHQGEGSAIPAEPPHILVDPIPSTSQPPTPSINEPLPQPSPPRQSDRQDTEIPQSQSPTFTHVVDEATTTGVQAIGKGPALPTSLPPATPTQQTFRNAILTLADRVKSLKVALKRKSKKVILSESEDKETENHGRKIHNIDDDPPLVRKTTNHPTTLEATKTLSKVASQKARSTDKGKRYKRRKMSKGKDIITGLDAEVEVNTGEVEINTGSIKVNTGSIEINTGREKINTGNAPAVVQTVNITIPSPVKGQREGKAPMTTEDVQVTKRTKAQIQQEEAGLAEAMRLQAQMDEEIAKQVHLDEMAAKRVQEEEELTDQEAQRMVGIILKLSLRQMQNWSQMC